MTTPGGSRDAPGDIVPKEAFDATWTRPGHCLVIHLLPAGLPVPIRWQLPLQDCADEASARDEQPEKRQGRMKRRIEAKKGACHPEYRCADGADARLAKYGPWSCVWVTHADVMRPIAAGA